MHVRFSTLKATEKRQLNGNRVLVLAQFLEAPPMAITDKNMQAKPTKSDQWFADDWGRGEGRFLGRITPGGKRVFYFRHTLSNGERDTLLIGNYDEAGKAGHTLKEARAKAQEWSKLYQSGIRDLRQHFQQLEDERQAAAEAEKRHLEEQARLADLEQQRRVTVRQLFARWADVELRPHTRGDGKRAGRKDGGQYTLEQFERRLFPRLGQVLIDEVKKADLLEVLDAARVEGRLRTGNMLLADMKQMFAFALNRELITRNPLDTVTKRMVGGGDVERERILSPEELQALVDLLPHAGLNKRTEIALWLILATGCRIGELMGAAWTNPEASGYHVSLFFLALPTAELAIARVAERVQQGGHNIPEDVIRRRFESGRRNFDQHYRTTVDAWALYDNAGDEPVLIEWGEAP